MVGSEQVDLLLINAPIHDYTSYPHFEATHSPPLGLLSLATTAAGHGFAASVYDAEFHQATADEVAAEVGRLAPRWVGLNAFSVNLEVVRAIVHRLEGEGARLMLGGPHVTNVSDELLIDHFGESVVFVRGDAEAAVVRLLEGAEPADIRGVFDHRTVAGRRTPEPPGLTELGSLPIIDRRFSEGEPYTHAGRAWYGMTVSRGCVFRCSFCAGSSYSNGMPYRATPTDRAFDEIDGLVGIGAAGIRIFDDLPFKGKRALLAFLAEAYERYQGRLRWTLSFPLQYCRSLTEQEWALLARYGLDNLTVGLEAADFELRASLGKRITDAALWETVRMALAAGVSLRFYFIIGLPGESAASTGQTLELARRLVRLPKPAQADGVRCSLFIYKPMPGSQMWQDLLAQGHSEDGLLRYTDFVLSVEEFRKHAWQSALQLSELTPAQLARSVDEFYSETWKVNSEAMHSASAPA